jgi:hypothetical protein
MTRDWPGAVPAQPGPAAASLAAPGPGDPQPVQRDPGNGLGPHRAAGRVERCPISDLPAYSCSHCTGRTGDAELMAALTEQDRADEAWAVPGHTPDGPWVTARFRGSCASCRDPITPGDQIRRSAGGGWLCEICIPASDDDPGGERP